MLLPHFLVSVLVSRRSTHIVKIWGKCELHVKSKGEIWVFREAVNVDEIWGYSSFSKWQAMTTGITYLRQRTKKSFRIWSRHFIREM